ncbi:dual specificity protein phosphatase family protein [Acidobacteriota bacterium]
MNRAPYKKWWFIAAAAIVGLACIGGCVSRYFGLPQRDCRDHLIENGIVYEKPCGAKGEPVERDPRWAWPVQDRPGLPNLFRVTPDFYRGAQPAPEGLEELSKLGIKTIINLRTSHDDLEDIKKMGVEFNYIHLPFNTMSPEFEDVVAFLKVFQDDNNLPLFLHCRRGADRTGMMTAAYRMVYDGWTVDEAIEEMARGGYRYNAFWRNLKHYLRKLDLEKVQRALEDSKELTQDSPQEKEK